MTIESGRMLAHYRIVEKIGEGGMGAVYLAEDTRLDRKVALKVLPPKFTGSAERRARFEREAKSVAALNHPNIVTLHSVEEADGVHFITMELVEGRPLSQCIPRGGVGLDRFFELALPIVDAISAAHDRGITHRDLKPDNIMVGKDGRVRILDFGLAKLQEGEGTDALASVAPTVTGEGKIVGTVAYMSPEQAQGQAVDHRTDIFSAGIILYQLATGERPFRGDNSVSMISSIMKDVPPPVHDRNPKMPTHLGRILRRCLEKDPDRRPQRARDLHHDLEDLRNEIQTRSIRASAGPAVPAGPARRGHRVWIGLGSLIVIFAAWAILFGPLRNGGRPPADGLDAPISMASVAVLPFVNMSGEKENEYFADGMTEELINSLVKLEGLKVSSRTSVFTFKGKDLTIGEIGRQLGVRHVVEGSVRRSGNQLRVTAQLIKVEDGFHLWSDTYDREMADVFRIQEEIARGIVDNLKVRLVGAEPAHLAGEPTENLDAYNLFLQGRFQLNRHTEESLRKGIELFEQAVAADPEYAPAHDGIAAGWFELSSWYRPPREVMPRAKEAVLEALRLDDSLAAAHSTLGNIHLIYEWDWENAEKEFLLAIELNRRSAKAHAGYGALLAARGRHEEAAEEVRLAHDLDPGANGVNYMATVVLYMGGRYQEAIDMARQVLEVNPEAHLPQSIMIIAYERLGMYREAITVGREVTRFDPSPFLKTFLIYALARAGERMAAETLLDELIEKTEARYVCPYEVAICFVGLDDPDTALDWFDRAYEARADCWIWGNVDPRLDELREDPRFQDLLRLVGHEVAGGAS